MLLECSRSAHKYASYIHLQDKLGILGGCAVCWASCELEVR